MQSKHDKALEAIEILNRVGVELGADFHTLNSSTVDKLVDEAKLAKYRKPANANGSTARYFHERLQRQAARKAKP